MRPLCEPRQKAVVRGCLKPVPDIPVDLHESIGDWIISYGNPDVHEPERIRRALADYDGQRTAPAAQPNAPAEPPAEDGVAYLIGRVLRHADDEAFKAFVELLAEVTKPEMLDEVLGLCEATAHVFDAKPNRARTVRTDCLAELISAVLNHPDTPPELYEGIAAGMNNVFNDLNNKAVTDSAEYIRLVLDQHRREDEQAQKAGA